MVRVWDKNHFLTANSTQCQLHWKEAAAHYKEPRLGIIPFQYEEKKRKRRGIMSKINRGYSGRKIRGILCLTKWEWVDKDDEEPLSCTCTPGMFLKGYPLTLLCESKGGMCWHHLQGVKLCFCIASQGGCCSRQGRATVWASHLQLINSHTLILTADHN